MILDAIYYMKQALKLAKKGIYSTSPNPNVGCVIVKNSNIIGRGFHYKAGMPHAEVFALEMAGEDAIGGDLYVTLEPCCHYGRTPPCINKIISSGIKRVFIGMQDPYFEVAGKGIELLRSAGIEIITGVLEPEIKELNLGFISRVKYNKPWITIKIGASLDGKIALSNGNSRWITGDKSRKDVHYLRARSDAIITGSNTVIKDNPQLTVRNINVDKQPVRVIIDSQLRTNYRSNIYDPNTRVILVTNPENDTSLFKNRQVDVWNNITDISRINICSLVKQLAEENYNYVLIEAGTTLNSLFLKLNLVDEIIIYMAPKLLGHQAKEMFNTPEFEGLNNEFNFLLHDMKRIGKDIKLTLRKA